MPPPASSVLSVLPACLALSCADRAQGPGEAAPAAQPSAGDELLLLPLPAVGGGIPLHAAIAGRRSVRTFAPDPLPIEALAALLWAGQGITDPEGGRAAPSAGATWPLELLVVAGAVTGLEPGAWRYDPAHGTLRPQRRGELRPALQRAALDQPSVGSAPAVLVVLAAYERVTARYGERGRRYAWMEAGHLAQGIALEAVSLGLGSVPVGAFDDRQVAEVLGCEDAPLYLIPVGFPARDALGSTPSRSP